MLIRDKHVDPNAEYHRSAPHEVGLNPAINLTNAVIALLRCPKDRRILDVGSYCRAKAGAVTVDLRIGAADSLLVGTTLAIHSIPEQFATTVTTAVFLVNAAVKTKAPTGALTFTAAHVISANKFGVILVQIDAAGAVSTKVPLATQAYNTAAAALAVLPSADADKVALGYIAIANNALDWTANTDDLTNASDVTTATFNSYDGRKPLTGAITPLALTEVPGVLSTTQANIEAEDGEYIAVLATTDGTGALTDGRLTFTSRSASLRGDT